MVPNEIKTYVDNERIEKLLEPLIDVSTGFSHVLALDIHGKIYSWGENDFGQVYFFSFL